MDLPTDIEQPTFNLPPQLVNHDLNPPPPPPPQPLPPTPASDFSSPQPDYAELITAAITALKEKEGSSRIAIAKYIDRVYSNLPPNHSALLTHHLKRLKNSGYLAMVKHSYMLAVPGSAPPPPSAAAAAVDSNGSDVSSNLTKRKPGRPPKLKAEAQTQAQFPAQFQDPFQAQLQAQQQQQAQFQQQFQNQPQFIQQQPQYVPQPQFQQFQADPLLQNQFHFQTQQQQQGYAAPNEAQNYTNLGAESVFVSLGLADGPVGVQNPAGSVPPPTGAPAPATAMALEGSSTKRRRGRPRKDGSTVVKSVEPKLPDQSGTKRRPGRPPKTGTVNASPGSAVASKPRGRPKKGSTPGRRGRPRKNVAANVGANAANIPAADPNIPAGGDPIPTPKRRGRPPKSSNQGGPVASAVGVTDVPIAAAFDSEDFPNTVGGVTNGATTPLGKRRGRPPKSYSNSSAAAATTTVKRPRKLSGRPLGRPKKNATSPAVSDPKLVVAYEDLKGKYEHMQSRIREATAALRPCLNAETPATALAAFQELEELSAPAGVDPMQQI